MKTEWVSFADLKRQVSIEDVLVHYGLRDGLRQRRDELVGLCPFHKETRGSFSASTTKNAFQCFGCNRKGNILDFVAFKEEVDIRQAALLIQGWFQVDSETHSEAPAGRSEAQGDISPEIPENVPLTFQLRGLDQQHAYLKERGLAKETIEAFGLGFYSGRGVMKDRIAIPIHNESGELVAYAGRWPGEPAEDEPKYKFPPGFAKASVVFNLERARTGELAKEKGLVVVEGFFDCFSIWQAGYQNVVSLMGTYLSPRQHELLVESVGPQGKLILLFDEDEAGAACRTQCLEELSSHVLVRAPHLPEGCSQPDELGESQVHQILAE